VATAATSSTTGSAAATSAAPGQTATATVEAATPAAPLDPDEATLGRATLRSLVPRSGPGVRPGVFDAVLDAPEGRRAAVAEPALTAAPLAHRSELAFYKLARALGVRIVPTAALRAVPIAELASALDRDATTRASIRELRVQNDGSVDVLFTTRSSPSTGSPWDAPRGLSFDPAEGPQAASWDRWASATAPQPGEDAPLLAQYLEMLALDYLAANVGRRSATLVDGHALVLLENASAFPAHADRPLLDRLLRKLRGAARFPRALRDALVRFDHAAAARAFNEGPFGAWLLAPRTIVELSERRAALLTLIEARVAEHGADAALSL
jgi:hypothetical protein